MIRCILVALVLYGGASLHAEDSENYELRGVWLNPHSFNEENRAETLKKIVAANLNTVFVASPEIDGNYGWSDPDEYRIFIDEAKAKGLSVHGWICNHRRRGYDSEVDFTTLEEQRTQARWAVSLLDRYPNLDGIHFDYIRYRDWEECDGKKMNGITDTIRQTRSAIKRKYPDKFLTATSFVAASANYHGGMQGEELHWEENVPGWYRDWYAENRGNWYETRHATVKKLKKGWLLGPVFLNYQQDPVTWVREGIVDAVMPMQYSFDKKKWDAEVDLWNGFLPTHSNRIYMGLGWLIEEGHEDWQYKPSEIVRHIQYGRSQGLKGFVIFQLGSEDLPGNVDDWDLVRALTIDSEINGMSAPYKNPARSPFRRIEARHNKPDAGDDK